MLWVKESKLTKMKKTFQVTCQLKEFLDLDNFNERKSYLQGHTNSTSHG